MKRINRTKRLLLILASFLVTTACGLNNQDDQQQKKFSIEEADNSLTHQNIIEVKELMLHQIFDQTLFLVADLMAVVEGKYDYNEIHRLLKMEIGDHVYKMVYGVPVVEMSGMYLPYDDIELVLFKEDVYLPTSFLDKVLGMDVVLSNESITFSKSYEGLMASQSNLNGRLNEEMTVEEMIEYLSFLDKPIEGAQASTIPNHLPGAKRPYRNGYHEGIDWYPYSSGQHISTTTPVYAMADGIVVRADNNYDEYSSPQIRNKDLAVTSKLGETPQYIFDRLRGRQVWVQYEKGVMIRFAHLDAIGDNIKVGNKVSKDTVIGYVGNSGTSGAVNGDGTQIHLHQDILIYGELFWKQYTPEQVKRIVLGIFGD
ncbi:MAG: M23 family metallopeptidase [Anaerobacillus sp.]|uniref:M23 family metallopeptidase n=1 Tax=Anaerobacillus sp. TaxID=1872506 RepID=UPI00391C88FC